MSAVPPTTLAAPRSSTRDLLSNATASAARLVAGTVLFVAMGRLLGPAAFGNFMSAMAVAALVAFISNLGFTQQALREVAARPAEAASIADSLASAKVTLACLVAVLVVLAGWAMGGVWWLIAVLTLALICDGAVEFLFALLKGHGHYGIEAGFSSVASIGHFVVVGAACVYTRDPTAIALAFLGSRALQLVAAAWACSQRIALPHLNAAWSRQWLQVRSGWAYGLDNGLGQLSAQVDTVLIRLLLGAHAAGIYQAGMRIVIGIQTLSAVAGNVFIPRLARTLSEPQQHRSAVDQLKRVYFGLAAVSGLGVWGLGWLLMQYGYGAAFGELENLLPWFAAMATLRVLAACNGVRLTAMGQQVVRSVVNMVTLSSTVMLIWLAAASKLGLQGAVAAVVVSSALVVMIYWWRVRVAKAQAQ
jgi:O-antigen/teichoic acid export membrane protein